MMIPVPQRQQALLKAGTAGNAALYFARMTAWDESGEGIKKRTGAIGELRQPINTRLRNAEAVLCDIHARQSSALGYGAQGGGMALEIRARLISPFVSGLGSGHATETGLILDRNSGLPYIPASSVKGVLRLACALRIAETEPDKVQKAKPDPKQKQQGDQWEIRDTHPLLRRYFGDTETDKADGVRGQLVFLDTFPAEVPESLLKEDIMAPHFGDYYSRKHNKGPVETEAPKPLKFPAVEEGTEFMFRCFALPLPDNSDADLKRPFDKTDEDNITEMFRMAFSELGFGAKTAIGYGRFEERAITNTPAWKKAHEAEQERKAKQREEQRKLEEARRMAEEAERKRLEEQRKADDEAERKRLEDERLHPWKPWLQQLDEEKNWDWAKLEEMVFDKRETGDWRMEADVAQKVLSLCKQVRSVSPENWKVPEYEDRCANWFEPTCVTWERWTELMTRIKAYKSYDEFQASPIAASELRTKAEAQELLKQLEKWGLKKAKKNSQKYRFFEEIQAQRRELKA